MCGAQANQKVDVIRRAADGFGDSVRRTNQSAEIFVQTISPVVRKERMPVFRAKHDVKNADSNAWMAYAIMSRSDSGD